MLRNDFLYILTTRGRINNIFVAIWFPHIINFERIIIFVLRLYAFLPRMQVNGLIAIYNLQIIETFMHIHTHLHTITVKNKLIWQLKHHQDTWPRNNCFHEIAVQILNSVKLKSCQVPNKTTTIFGLFSWFYHTLYKTNSPSSE